MLLQIILRFIENGPEKRDGIQEKCALLVSGGRYWSGLVGSTERQEKSYHQISCQSGSCFQQDVQNDWSKPVESSPPYLDNPDV